MADIAQLEQHVQEALKARDQIAVDTLRGLKTRLQNERIATGADLKPEQVVALVRSEVKRRQDAQAAYKQGSRPELCRYLL